MSLTRILFLPVVVMILGTTCSDNTSEPPPSNATVEGPSSHDWTWEYTIIDPANTTGHLWDVCYINDTCIWAVGQIEHKGENYNACRWDGKEWRVEKVYDDPTGSATEPGVHQLHTLYGTSPDNIWFVKGNAFIHWDGHRYMTDRSLVGQIHNALHESWGDGPDNIYAAGYGEIVHYDGHYWKRLENDIEQDITAIHGNGDTVLVAATGPGDAGPSVFYTIVGEKVEFFSQDSILHGVRAIWFNRLDDVYTDGARSIRFDGKEWNETVDYRKLLPSGWGYAMAANSRWDILVAGTRSTIRHYNNNDWKQWLSMPGLESACFNGCTIRGDEAWAVGLLTQGTEVLIVKGTRSAQ